MAQRLVRAKRKIRDARIPVRGAGRRSGCRSACRLGAGDALPDLQRGLPGLGGRQRWSGPSSAPRRSASRGCLVAMMPREPEASGAAGADAAARLAARGAHRRRRRPGAARPAGPLPLGSRARLRRGLRSSRRPVPPGRVPTRSRRRSPRSTRGAERAAETDWPRIARLYSWLAAIDPSPVIELNRAVAVAMVDGPEAGLGLVNAIAGPRGLRALPRRACGSAAAAGPPRRGARL